MKEINKTKIVVLILIILAIICAVIGINANKTREKLGIEIKEIQAKYYVFQKEDQYGVIDTDGKIIIEANYDDINIPNPEKEFFVCRTIYDNAPEEIKFLNANSEEMLNEYEEVLPIELKNDENKVEYEKEVLQYKENGKYGLINFEGKKITQAQYDQIEALKYKEGELLVKRDNQYGVINSNGKEIIKPQYDSIEGDGYYNARTKYQHTGYIVCKKQKDGYKYGYINNKGKQILKNEYSEIYRVLDSEEKENVYLIARKNGKVGFVKNNKKILDYEYQNIEYDSTNELIKVQKNTNYGVYNINGEEIIPVKYAEISFRGKYIYTQKEEKVEYFTLNGQEVKNLNYLSINETDSEKFYTCINNEGLYGILDKNENVLVENEYQYLEYLYSDYFIAIEEDKLGVIKSNNDIMIPFEYSTIDKIENTNLVQATRQDGSVVLFSKDLKMVDGMENPTIVQSGNITKIYSEKQNKYFDKEGNELKIQDAFPVSKLYPKNQEGKWGFEDKDGKVVVECKYDYAMDLNQYGYAAVKKDGKWGCIDEDGNIVLEPKYEIEEGVLPSFIGVYYTLEQGNSAIFYEE